MRESSTHADEFVVHEDTRAPAIRTRKLPGLPTNATRTSCLHVSDRTVGSRGTEVGEIVIRVRPRAESARDTSNASVAMCGCSVKSDEVVRIPDYGLWQDCGIVNLIAFRHELVGMYE